MRAVNDRVRLLAKEHADVSLVDLDKDMSGQKKLMRDFLDVSTAGEELLGKRVARTIKKLGTLRPSDS